MKESAAVFGLTVACALVALGCSRANDGERVDQVVPNGPGQTPQAGTATGGAPARGRAWVIFGTDTVVAEVASTPAQRQQGLMHRTEVLDGTGMLFVFEEEQELSFWMQNTYVALDVAFMGASGRIVDIQQMQPQTTDIHTGRAPALFALEVRQGWFAEHDITPGQTAQVVFGPR